MRLGVIDLGTNSVRFDVHHYQSSNRLECLYRMKEMVQLGEGLFHHQRLQQEPMDRALRAIKNFIQVCKKFDVEEVLAVGTSAMREARNADVFEKKIKKEFGIKIKVISGQEEARLIMKAIHAFEPTAGDSFAFVDIGGGSTEVGFSNQKTVEFLFSYNVGAARIRQMFSTYPPTAFDIEQARHFIRQELGRYRGFKDWPKVDKLLGASGSIKALCKIMKAMGYEKMIELRKLQSLIEDTKDLNEKELIYIPGMEERRTHLILAGAIILEEVMKFFGAQEVYRTRYALREGVLVDRLEELGLVDADFILEV